MNVRFIFAFLVFLNAYSLTLNAAFASLTDIEAAVMDKKYDEARDLASKLLKETVEPKQRIEAEYYLGLSQLRLGKYPEARKAFVIVKQASSSQDFYDKASLGMVEALYMAGFYKDALKQGQALLRKSPNSQSKSLIYLKMARVHLKLMQWQQAKDFLQKIINEFPQSLEVPIARSLLEEKEYFTVQVGSFLDRTKALALTEELKAKSQYAYIIETTSPDGNTFYRVRVGEIASLNQAQALKSDLAAQGYPALIYP